MKRFLAILLALCLMLPLTSAFALFDFTGTLGNDPTFETLEEARISGPEAIAAAPDSAAMGNAGVAQGAHPALDDFPALQAHFFRIFSELWKGSVTCRGKCRNLRSGFRSGPTPVLLAAADDHRLQPKTLADI